jgi:hypothetical protein
VIVPHWRTAWRRRRRAHYSRGLRLRYLLLAAVLAAAAIVAFMGLH